LLFFRWMISQVETDNEVNFAIVDNRQQRNRIQAELVLIQSLSLALDAEMDFELAPPAPE
jgi:hypothetical protein